MFRTIALILSGNATYYLLVMVRNLVIARLISIEDFGVAATFAISMAVVEMMSDLGFQQLIVQAKEGNDPELQSALHGFQLLRGFVGAGALFLLANPIALFLNIPHAAWAYQMLALVPLVNGLLHFDIHRLNRRMVFLPFVLTKTLPALIALALVWPFDRMFGDWRVMLYSLLAQAVLSVGVSHLVAERRYRLHLDGAVMRRAVAFGWPLLGNAVLLFAVFHGEKLIVGRELGMASLAVFAMGFTLTLRPALVVTSSAQSFFLPQLSAARDDRDAFQHLTMTILQVGLISGAGLVLAVFLIGEPFVHLVLGEKYAPLTEIFTWLAILQGVRAFKVGAAVASVAQGRTGNAMAANTMRVATLPVSWWVVVNGGSVLDIVWVALGGEVAGFALALVLVAWRLPVNLAPMALPVLIAAAMLAGAALLDGRPGVWPAALVILVFAGLVAACADMRRYLVRRRVRNHAE